MCSVHTFALIRSNLSRSKHADRNDLQPSEMSVGQLFGGSVEWLIWYIAVKTESNSSQGGWPLWVVIWRGETTRRITITLK